MNKIKIFSLIAVCTALFVGCDKHITGNKDKVVCLKNLGGTFMGCQFRSI